MIKHLLLSALLVCAATTVSAQTEKASTSVDTKNAVTTSDAVVVAKDDATSPDYTSSAQPVYRPDISYSDTSHSDSLHLPRLNSYGQALPLMHPLAFGGYWGSWYGGWGLHKGLNISLGASVFAQFGKGAHHGAGFEESISAMYAMPINKHLSVAVGGYFDNINWGSYNTHAAGLSAIVGYQFNDKWEAYIYAQKCLTGNSMRTHMPMMMYDYADMNDRIGAAVKYNFSPAFSMQLSVEMDSRPAWNNVPGPIDLRPNINKSLNDRP